MTDENQLNLEEMIALAEKVENWERGSYYDMIFGSLNDLKISVGFEDSRYLFPKCYRINISKGNIDNRCIRTWFTKEGEKIRQTYENAMNKVERNEQKAREEVLRYARSLLNQ